MRVIWRQLGETGISVMFPCMRFSRIEKINVTTSESLALSVAGIRENPCAMSSVTKPQRERRGIQRGQEPMGS